MTTIIYASTHHGNTLKLLEAIQQADPEMTLINAKEVHTADLAGADRIGFASGIFFGKFDQDLLDFAEHNLPEGKAVFLICTFGGAANYGSIEQIVAGNGCNIIGRYGCKGFDTFGPFKVLGGIAKGHPDEADLAGAVEFYKNL